MQLCGRAYYNLLMMDLETRENVEIEPWQIESYRDLDTDECFTRLKKLRVPLDVVGFSSYVDAHESPEELALEICSGKLGKRFEQIYLLVFELWRRLYPEKESLSIFCDKLDHAIGLYDEGTLSQDEMIEELSDLQRVLDENVDQGQNPHAVFETVSANMAHDLQRFLYDFALAQIEQGAVITASELIENFYSYLCDPIWFDFLRIRALIESEGDEALHLCEQLIDFLEEHINVDLLFEMLEFLVEYEATDFFERIFGILIRNIRSEEDLHELAELCIHHFTIFGQEDSISELKAFFKSRYNVPQEVDRKAVETLNQITLTGLNLI